MIGKDYPWHIVGTMGALCMTAGLFLYLGNRSSVSVLDSQVSSQPTNSPAISQPAYTNKSSQTRIGGYSTGFFTSFHEFTNKPSTGLVKKVEN